MLRLVEGPTVEPVTLVEAKRHLRVVHDSEDSLISLYIQAAREHVEDFTRRSLLPTRWEWVRDRFDDVIELPRPPLLSVETVSYTDSLGDTVVLDPARYRLVVGSDPGRIHPAYGTRWPLVRTGSGDVVTRYTAGYATPALVPARAKQAMLFLVGHWFVNRESVITGTISTQLPQTVEALLWPLRYLRF